MPDPFSRPLSVIDRQMRELLTLNRAAEAELEQVREQMLDLQARELELLDVIDARRRRIAVDLLDERLRSRATEVTT